MMEQSKKKDFIKNFHFLRVDKDNTKGKSRGR
jgi:hypothetical protein